jgi:hypothetical protein
MRTSTRRHANVVTCSMCSMETNVPGPKPPTHLAIKLPVDVAKLLHRLAYETGQTKRDLVIAAIRKTYRSNDSRVENQRSE